MTLKRRSYPFLLFKTTAFPSRPLKSDCGNDDPSGQDRYGRNPEFVTLKPDINVLSQGETSSDRPENVLPM
jgi:hypothetical protein